jgi:hypothetical protein
VSNTSENRLIFLDKRNLAIPGVSYKKLLQLVESTLSSGLLPEQIVEGASYSFAMVSRYALGLNADQAQLAVLVDHSLLGAIAIATARHLTYSGSQVKIFVAEPLVRGEEQNIFNELLLDTYLKPLLSHGIKVEKLENLSFDTSIYHSILCGLSLERGDFSTLADSLNDGSTPIHSLIAPYGLLSNSPHTVFSSSTLSLALPLEDLAKKKDQIGRHYLCDISISPKSYQEIFTDDSHYQLFTEQPVISLTT